ncbi:hypothetical protein KP509_10G016100 [Ceratopteris richardii]|uniref:Uncharacterized protein n=1 Tax=Ceratopteris richardii TaxID=49495 RepID=A0A8T2TYN4_CERRI|nr:hypothetical protein KP509_10G016100 [Ceratopteris richardii]
MAADGGGKAPSTQSKNSGRPPPTPPTQQHQAGRRRVNRHGQQPRYFGRMSTNVTEYLKNAVPSHAFNPTLMNLPPPSYHRKASSISEYIERQVRPPPHSRRPYTAPDVYFGRRASNVTDHLRFIPPSHLGIDAQSKALPYFGRLATSVTDPSKYEGLGDGGEESITSHWSPASRPGSARLPIAPQHVKRDVLFTALSARGEHTNPSGRRPTNIGWLLKHQFAHLVGAERSTVSSTNKRPMQKAQDEWPGGSARGRRPATAPSAEDYKRGHKHFQSSESPRPKDQCMSSRPATARSSSSKLTTKPFISNSATETMPAPKPTAISSDTKSKSSEGLSTGSKRRQRPDGDGGAANTVNQQHPEVHDGNRLEVYNVGEHDEKDVEMEEAQPRQLSSPGDNSGEQSAAMCDDDSSEVTEELAPEKMEFVSRWVQQEPDRHGAWTEQLRSKNRTRGWPKTADKAPYHGRRATSVTKFNIWT